MTTVSDIRERWSREQAANAEARRDRARRGGDNGGNGGEPPMSNLESRVDQLERDVSDIKTTMARIETKLDGFVTKGEFHQAMNAQTWKMVTALVTSMGIMTAIFTAIVKWL